VDKEVLEIKATREMMIKTNVEAAEDLEAIKEVVVEEVEVEDVDLVEEI
jgi:hypothetical protein